MSILITGGAGYIGAHVVRLLVERGDDVVVVDDFSTGERERVDGASVVELDIVGHDATDRLHAAMITQDVDAVVHFAAKKRVGESVQRPAWYASQNVSGLANVLMAIEETNIERFVFSSSAAVYGTPDVVTVTESDPTSPINPYGRTKLFGEWMVEDAARAGGRRAASLRYFNVAGAGWPDLGDPAALNLVTMAFERMDRGEPPLIFGDDYPTPDGTCIRDYVHVLDLAAAHIATLDFLRSGPPGHAVFNVGTGRGSSVREVIDAIGVASGQRIEPVVASRRAGDPPRLIADTSRIRDVLGWRSEHELPQIVGSAWESHIRRMKGRAR